MAEGAFPNLEDLKCWISKELYLTELTAIIENGVPCCATLRRVELEITCDDLLYLPRLVQVLARLPQLEHVALCGGYHSGAWRVEGARDALSELSKVLAGAQGITSPDELTKEIQRILLERYE
jgi:hypothetical protein